MIKEDRERTDNVRDKLKGSELDGMVCRLSENVLFLTGYWPMSGFSFVIFPREGELTLIVPEGELRYAKNSWVSDIRTFGWGQVKDGDPYKAIGILLRKSGQKRFGKGTRVGFEESFEFVAPAHMAGEVLVSSSVTKSVISESFPDARLEDARIILDDLRTTKTLREIEKLRITNEIACLGLAKFKEMVKPGVKESEVSAAVEEAIYTKGVGYKGVRSARAWAYVMSGLDTSTSHRPYLISTDRRLKEGDLVIIELGTVVDGYWSDLTRTIVVGNKATQEQIEIHGLVLSAQKAAVEKMTPGTFEKEVDKSARGLIDKNGYKEYFVHHTGHGIGFRYHEPYPFLHPDSKGILKEGMVTTVEPGIYKESFGGIRIEDDVVITNKGTEYLSTRDNELLE